METEVFKHNGSWLAEKTYRVCAYSKHWYCSESHIVVISVFMCASV